MASNSFPGSTGASPGSSGTSSRMSEVGTTVRDTVKEEAAHVKDALSETSADLSERASALADEAAGAAKAKAEEAKDGLSSMLESFGGALRAASDHLASEQPAASKMVAEAASGLEKLSGSLGSKPLGAVLEDMRSVGRDNAGGLFAGSVLAGVALGRFFRAGESDGGGNSGDAAHHGHATGPSRSSSSNAGLNDTGSMSVNTYDRSFAERDEPVSSAIGGSGAAL